MFRETGFKRVGEMRFSTNPCAAERAMGRPPWHAAEATAEKSPPTIAGVGTNAVRVPGSERWVVR